MSVMHYDLVPQEALNVGLGTTTRRSPGGGTAAVTQVGIHSLARGQAKGTASWTPGTVAVGGSVSKAVTVPGAALGDFALASFSLDLQGLTLSAYVSAANVVTVVVTNPTGTGVTIAAGTVAALALGSR